MAATSNIENDDYSFLRGGLLYNLLAKAGIAKPGLNGVRLRAGLVVLITYVPLVVLALMQGVAWNGAVVAPFLYDIAEATRFIIVGPLLILSEVIIDPWLVGVVRRVRQEVVPADELPHYDKLVTTAARRRDSYIAELLLLALSFGLQWLEVHVVPHSATTTWRQMPGSNTPTYAFFFYVYFAKPLIRFLWLRWAWRYVTWSLFLMRIPGLRPQIVPTYPDRSGGLGFIATGHQRFAALALAFGAQAASIVDEQITFDGKALMSFKYDVLGIVVIVLLVFLTPLLAFTGKMLQAKRLGLRQYGQLANEYSSNFHAKWIAGARGNEQLLGTSDIQSLADLSNSYDIVRIMSVFLISKTNVIVFASATLLPFVPLLLTVYPFDQLLTDVLKKVM